ncbi:MAG TPA: S-layer homology domain-containing protein [Anaerovoracaceae bacterium]|nr:S-layer homology domain-containing protein [Anaerovoracaceae bacterium]
MKLKIKIITLATVLILSMTGQSFAATSPFTDINDTKSKDQIVQLYEDGVIKGMGNGLFNPDGTLTAAQGVQLIVNAFDISLAAFLFIKAPLATDWFKNANNNAWYADALIKAGANNIGLPADLDPNAKWTKEDFTYYLVMAMESRYQMPVTDLMYIEAADEADMTIAYTGVIQKSMKYGITALDQDKKFYPKKMLTRAEAAEMIYNGRTLVEEMKLEVK